MLKKKFFAKALAFAMVTGLMATAAPIGAGAPVVQVLAAAGTTATAEKSVYTIKVEDADGNVADTTYEFIRTAKDTITVVKTGTEEAYYKIEGMDAPAKVGDSITIPVDNRQGAVTLTVSTKEDGTTNAKTVTVPAALAAAVSYTGYGLAITPSAEDMYVFVQVLKKAGEDKGATTYVYSCLELSKQYGNTLHIDLSFLKGNKDSYLRVWGDKCSGKIDLAINAQPTKEKVKYAPKTFPTLEVKLADGDDEAAIATKTLAAIKDSSFQTNLKKYYKESFNIGDAEYEFRGLYSSNWGDLLPWIGYDDDKYVGNVDALASLKVAGTTLVLRQKATETTYKQKEVDDPNNAGEKIKVDDLDKDGNLQVEKEGAPAGVEIKVKIPASPKAPKVTIDYTKGTIKFPKSGEYGIIYKGELKYVGISNGGTLELKKVLENIADKLDLKDGQDDPAKTDFVNKYMSSGFNLIVRTNDSKKGTSNPAFVAVKATPSFNDDGWGKLTGSDGKEIATYAFDESGATLTVKDTSLTFEYEDGGKWKKISSGKAIKGKNSDLTVRIAGVKDKDESKASLPSGEKKLEKKESKAEAKLTAADNKSSIAKTGKVTLTVAVKDRDGEDVTVADLADTTKVKSVTWKSSDITVATVADLSPAVKNQQEVTGVKAGKATITVTVTFADETVVEGTFEITVTES